VWYSSGINRYVAEAKREVILAADFFTPHILKLSGIENQEVLASACLVEHERVGEYY